MICCSIDAWFFALPPMLLQYTIICRLSQRQLLMVHFIRETGTPSLFSPCPVRMQIRSKLSHSSQKLICKPCACTCCVLIQTSKSIQCKRVTCQSSGHRAWMSIAVPHLCILTIELHLVYGCFITAGANVMMFASVARNKQHVPPFPHSNFFGWSICSTVEVKRFCINTVVSCFPD